MSTEPSLTHCCTESAMRREGHAPTCRLSELEVRAPGIRSLRQRIAQFDRTKGEYPPSVTIPTRLAAALLEAFDEECCT